MQESIIIKGAREHNLKNVSLTLPRNKLIVFTGLSGSGKSSLAFDTIFAEGQRRYVESLSAYARQFLGEMSKPDVDEIEGLSPAISIDQKTHSANPRSTVATITEIYDYLRVLFARIGRPFCPHCQIPIQKLTSAEMIDFIFADATGIQKTISPKLINRETMILSPLVRGRKGEYHQLLYDLYNSGFARVRVDGRLRNLRNRLILDKNIVHTIELVVDAVSINSINSRDKEGRGRLAEAVETALKYGQGNLVVAWSNGTEKNFSSTLSCSSCGFSFPEIEPRLFSFNSPYGACLDCHGLGTVSLFSEEACHVCLGKRLKPAGLSVKINDQNIFEITALGIGRAIDFFEMIKLNDVDRAISVAVIKEIKNRLRFMFDVGLHYLTLNRRAGSLSGGEAQRIRLASQIGSGLVGALYVLDEPSIGLHQRDNDKLLQTLKHLRDLGNTIIVVEHDEETMIAADHIVEFGPGAGIGGGEIVASGATPEIYQDKKSLTMAYLRGDRKIPTPIRRRTNSRERLKVFGATANNLKNINVEIPLRRLVCVTGVSGSGKSTLVEDILANSLANKLNGASHKVGQHKIVQGVEYLDRVAVVDQSPIGRTPRSNPATYTGMFGDIREFFAATAEARYRGYKPGRFSFNVPGGRCEHCAGHGLLAIEMHFLPTVYVTCDVCQGQRFDRETLEVNFRDKNIHEVLKMTVAEAKNFFEDIPRIVDIATVLDRIGLGYIELGQSATTLSGGEAQRIKLGYELSKRNIGRTLYILDEPTTGLHFEDIRKLLEVLHSLVERNNTVLVIEHNLDVIKNADYIIDLGPDGGEAGGQVVAVGTPEEVAKYSDSYTAKYLKRVLPD